MLCPKISTSQKKLAPTGRHGRHVFATLCVRLLDIDCDDGNGGVGDGCGWDLGLKSNTHQSFSMGVCLPYVICM